MAWIVLLGEVIPSYWDITKKLTSNRKSDILSHSIDCTVQLTLTIVCAPSRPGEEGEKLMSGDKKDVEGAPEEVVDLSKLEVSAKASQVLATEVEEVTEGPVDVPRVAEVPPTEQAVEVPADVAPTEPTAEKLLVAAKAELAVMRGRNKKLATERDRLDAVALERLNRIDELTGQVLELGQKCVKLEADLELSRRALDSSERIAFFRRNEIRDLEAQARQLAMDHACELAGQREAFEGLVIAVVAMTASVYPGGYTDLLGEVKDLLKQKPLTREQYVLVGQGFAKATELRWLARQQKKQRGPDAPETELLERIWEAVGGR